MNNVNGINRKRARVRRPRRKCMATGKLALDASALVRELIPRMQMGVNYNVTAK